MRWMRMIGILKLQYKPSPRSGKGDRLRWMRMIGILKLLQKKGDCSCKQLRWMRMIGILKLLQNKGTVVASNYVG